MEEMARQTKTAEFFNPTILFSLLDFITEFIALIAESVMDIAGSYWDLYPTDLTLIKVFRQLIWDSEQTRGQKEEGTQRGSWGGGPQAEGVREGRGGLQSLPGNHSLQKLQQVNVSNHSLMQFLWYHEYFPLRLLATSENAGQPPVISLFSVNYHFDDLNKNKFLPWIGEINLWICFLVGERV